MTSIKTYVFQHRGVILRVASLRKEYKPNTEIYALIDLIRITYLLTYLLHGAESFLRS